MRLEDVMTRRVETITEDRAAEEAWDRMRARRIHHLVVVRGGRVVGILSERDLGGRAGAAVRPGRTVADLMTPHAVIADPRAPVRRAANLLRGRSIGCLPVVEGERLLGIVTLTDLLRLIGRGVERPIERTQRRPVRRQAILRRRDLRALR